MRGKLIAVVIALLGIGAILVAGVVLAGGEERATPSPQPAGGSLAAVETGSPAPALSGTDPITGKAVSLADFEGKPVVINIWASWCPPCNDEAPDLARLAADHPEAVVLGIDYQDAVPDAKRFYEKYGWKHPSIFDPVGELAARLGLVGLPTTVFLTADHRESSRIVGPGDLAAFEKGLERAEQPS